MAARPSPSGRAVALSHPTALPFPPLRCRAVEIVRTEQRDPFITLDGSEIRELAGPPSGNSANQSLAEATVPPGARTEAHYHRTSEEIYLFTAGAGRMSLAGEAAAVRAGDCVVIPPGAEHQLVNDGEESLVLLCCCSPPYSHEDTVLTAPGAAASQP
jgi:mannose-6-phosphate isomerase-like protein (cupin superfamily)